MCLRLLDFNHDMIWVVLLFFTILDYDRPYFEYLFGRNYYREFWPSHKYLS